MEPSCSQKWFSIWRPSAILNLWISEIFSHFRRQGQNLRPHTKFCHIRMIHGWDNGDITIFKMAAVRHVGFIVTGRLNLTLDIVLNFDVHQFHTFLYTSTIMFHHFSLKLPIFAVIFKYFWKIIWENIKFKRCKPQKVHLCVRPHDLNSRCLTYFYICDLYTRWKIVWLIDCVLVRKKNETSPICLAKMG